MPPAPTVAAARAPSRQACRPAPYARRLILGLLAFCAFGAAAPSASRAEEPIELAGTWFVLVHYKDSATANPEAMRWLDLAWAFTYKGSRLEWTEYPMVVFENGEGRFEARAGNPRARVLAAWEPNASQRKDIEAGPRVNPRGIKIKTLRGSSAKGWQSSRRMTQTSAMTVGYQENLSIETRAGLPVFSRMDVVGNALSNSGKNGSTYRVDSMSDDGQALSGTYTRDAIRAGTFRMWRTKPVRGLPERKGTPNDRANERAREAYEAQLE
jgi:hypothetical protein